MQTTSRALNVTAEVLMAYQNPRVVERYVEEYGGTREEAQRCFDTLKQFLAACALGGGDRVISKPVDNMWHAFILFTKDYHSFCDEYLGCFVHHTPTKNDRTAASARMRTVAEMMFGPVYEDLWPIGATGADCESSSCDCCPAV